MSALTYKVSFYCKIAFGNYAWGYHCPDVDRSCDYACDCLYVKSPTAAAHVDQTGINGLPIAKYHAQVNRSQAHEEVPLRPDICSTILPLAKFFYLLFTAQPLNFVFLVQPAHDRSICGENE